MSEVEKINGYEIHPYASRFPLLAGEKFDELVASIKMNGLGEKIILDHLGNVVDGRNRLKACGKAGVAPQFKQLDEDADILEIVLDRNVRRRHLTPSQLAMIAADLSTMSTGRPSKDSTGVSMEVAAEKLNVSRSSVASAKKVKSKGTPELQEAVVTRLLRCLQRNRLLQSLRQGRQVSNRECVRRLQRSTVRSGGRKPKWLTRSYWLRHRQTCRTGREARSGTSQVDRSAVRQRWTYQTATI